MRFVLVVGVMGALGCGASPYLVERTSAELNPDHSAVQAADRPDLQPDHAFQATPQPPPAPLSAVVVPGLERVERIVSFDQAMCGLRPRVAATCSGDATRRFPSLATLKDVKRLATFGDVQCALAGTKLSCTRGGETSSRLDYVEQSAVSDFVMLSAEMFLLQRASGAVHLFFASDPGAKPPVVFKDAVEIGLAGDSIQLACARTRRGTVECVRVAQPSLAAAAVTNLPKEIAQVVGSFARAKTGEVFRFGVESLGAFTANQVTSENGQALMAGDLALTNASDTSARLCAVTLHRSVECLDASRQAAPGVVFTQSIILPGVPKAFRPLGAPCVELESGLVACWSDGNALTEIGRQVIGG
jgi:hypothetical protein